MYILLGLGKSNLSIKKYFDKNNIIYFCYDDKNNKNFDFEKLKNEVKVVIKSNGINNDHWLLNKIKEMNISIISDLQFFYNINKNNINDNYCLVTGSNGKTTVVSLLEKCLENSIAIGNNGLALFDYIDDKKNKIIEVSSFMLEYIDYINFKYNIITNIYPTHLEHHKNFSYYIKAKTNFLKYLSSSNYIIYNYDDVILERIIRCYDINKISVSLYNPASTIYLKNNYIHYNDQKLININYINIIGKHNLYNIMYIIGIIYNHSLIKKNYKEEIYNYHGEKYRLEIIYKNKFTIINDSKSTNFKALSVALDSIDKNIVLIVGGMKREDNYDLLKNYLNKINKVYCFGENKYDFYNYFINYNINCNVYDSLENVINNIIVSDNETILFSPGSISFDQFDNFEQRGETFNKLINKNLHLLIN